MSTIIHSLPLGIAYDGDAEVQKGFPFTTSREADSQTKTSATFRGRRLAGVVHSVPEGLQCNLNRKTVLFHFLVVHLKHDMEDEKALVSSAVFESSNVTLIEWTKEDIPERPKLALDSFSRLFAVQNQVNYGIKDILFDLFRLTVYSNKTNSF